MPFQGFINITKKVDRTPAMDAEGLATVLTYQQSQDKKSINVPNFSNRHTRKNHYKLDKKFQTKVKGYLKEIVENEKTAFRLFQFLSGCASKQYTLFLKDIVDDNAKALFFERLLRHTKKCFSRQVMESKLFGEVGFESSEWYFRSFSWYFLFADVGILKNVYTEEGFKMPTPTFYKYLAELEEMDFVKVGNSYKPTKVKQIKRRGKIVERQEKGYSCAVYPTLSLLRYLAPALCKILYKQLKNDKYIKKVYINDDDIIRLYTIDWQAYLVSKEQEEKKIEKNQYKDVYKETKYCTYETLTKEFIKEFAHKECGYSFEYSEQIANFVFLNEEELKKLTHKQKAKYHQFRRYFYRVLNELKDYDADRYEYVKVRYNVTARGKIKKTVSGRVSPTPTAVRQKKELTKDVMTAAGMPNNFDIDCDLFYTTYVRKYGVEPTFKDDVWGTHNHIIKHTIAELYKLFCEDNITWKVSGKDVFAVKKLKAKEISEEQKQGLTYVNGYWTNQFGQCYNFYKTYGSSFKRHLFKAIFACPEEERNEYINKKFTSEQIEAFLNFEKKYSSEKNQAYIRYQKLCNEEGTREFTNEEEQFFGKFAEWRINNEETFNKWIIRFTVDAVEALQPFLRSDATGSDLSNLIKWSEQASHSFDEIACKFLYKKCKKVCAAQYRAYFEPSKQIMRSRLRRALREEALKIGNKDSKGRPILDGSDLFFLKVASKVRDWLEFHKLFLDVPTKGFMITSSASFYTTAKIRDLGYKCVNKYDEYWSDCPQEKLSKLVKKCYKDWSYTFKKPKPKVPIYN